MLGIVFIVHLPGMGGGSALLITLGSALYEMNCAYKEKHFCQDMTLCSI